MRTHLSVFIAVPIEDVFAFFDDPANSMAFQEHASEHLRGSELIDVAPDGRRTLDVRMQSGPTKWTQTIVQEVREVPTRQVARSWTWTRDRNERHATISTDRRFTPVDGGTSVDVTVAFHVEHPWRHPMTAVLNRVWGQGAAKLELEHSLHNIAEHLEARHRAAAGT